MAEREQAHRIETEKTAVTASVAAEHRGQILGAIVAMTAIVAAVGNVALGGPWQASVALVGVPVLAAAQALILGHLSKKD